MGIRMYFNKEYLDKLMQNSVHKGVILTLPLALSAATYGSVLGMLAADKAMTVFELLILNIFMFAGSSQFLIVEMWQPQVSFWAVVVAVLAMNVRYFLASASIASLFQQSKLIHKMTIIHFLVDESWAITLSENKKGQLKPLFLLGSGLCLMIAWNMGTLLGYYLGGLIEDPEKFALDFAFTAVFVAILISICNVKRDVLPWIVTIITSIISYKLLPGSWYILIGSISGALSSIVFIKPNLNNLEVINVRK